MIVIAEGLLPQAEPYATAALPWLVWAFISLAGLTLFALVMRSAVYGGVLKALRKHASEQKRDRIRP